MYFIIIIHSRMSTAVDNSASEFTPYATLYIADHYFSKNTFSFCKLSLVTQIQQKMVSYCGQYIDGGQLLVQVYIYIYMLISPLLFCCYILTGEANTELCSATDYEFMCTIVSGEIEWNRERGGKYCCLGDPSEAYYIHWIDPGKMSSG